MVFTCSSCGRKYAKACGYAFFSFPKNQLLGTAWLKFCGLDLHPGNDTSNMKLCSEHFEKSSFRITRKDGPLILKPNAIPTLLGKNRSHSEKSVSNIEIQQVVPLNQPVTRQVLKDNTAGSSTVPYCRQEDVADCTTAVTPTKKRQIWGPRHGLDMSPSHFNTPTKASRNLLIVKQDIMNRDARIKQLIQKNYRMKRKIECLEHIIEHLKSTPSHNGELS
ncbi:hypothetical protein CBL_06918 [Carabus blaptoides fortunei]